MTEPSRRSAVVRRVLPATPDVVYDEWLDVDALAEFIGPHPAAAKVIECDPRIGGKLHIVMSDSDVVVQITGEYRELDCPNRLRFTSNIPRSRRI